MKHFLLLLFVAPLCAIGQIPIDVADNTMKVSGFGSEVVYYAFASGDKIIFSFEEANGKEVKEVEIKEYDGSSRFMDYKTNKVENRTIDVFKTGIFVFRFSNSAIGGRICRYSIKRIPGSEQTQQFNTSVYWRTQNDTTYTSKPERYLISRALVAKRLIEPTEFYINSGSNALFRGGKSRVTVPIQLPANTVEWYYQVAASRKNEDVNAMKSQFLLAGKIASLLTDGVPVDKIIDRLTTPPGADYCDVYLTNFANSRLFEAKESYRFSATCSRENIKTGSVRVNYAMETPTVCLKNPNSLYGVNVVLEVVAIVQEEEWGIRDVSIPNVVSRQIPYIL